MSLYSPVTLLSCQHMFLSPSPELQASDGSAGACAVHGRARARVGTHFQHNSQPKIELVILLCQHNLPWPTQHCALCGVKAVQSFLPTGLCCGRCMVQGAWCVGVAKHYGHAVNDQHIPLRQSVGGAAAGLEVRVHSRIVSLFTWCLANQQVLQRPCGGNHHECAGHIPGLQHHHGNRVQRSQLVPLQDPCAGKSTS